MSWAEVKTINSNPSVPLNNLIGYDMTNYNNISNEINKYKDGIVSIDIAQYTNSIEGMDCTNFKSVNIYDVNSGSSYLVYQATGGIFIKDINGNKRCIKEITDTINSGYSSISCSYMGNNSFIIVSFYRGPNVSSSSYGNTTLTVFRLDLESTLNNINITMIKEGIAQVNGVCCYQSTKYPGLCNYGNKILQIFVEGNSGGTSGGSPSLIINLESKNCYYTDSWAFGGSNIATSYKTISSPITNTTLRTMINGESYVLKEGKIYKSVVDNETTVTIERVLVPYLDDFINRNGYKFYNESDELVSDYEVWKFIGKSLIFLPQVRLNVDTLCTPFIIEDITNVDSIVYSLDINNPNLLDTVIKNKIWSILTSLRSDTNLYGGNIYKAYSSNFLFNKLLNNNILGIKIDTPYELWGIIKSVLLSEHFIDIPVTKNSKIICRKEDIDSIEGNVTETDYGYLSNTDGVITLHPNVFINNFAFGLAY